MGRILKWLFYLAVLGVAVLIAYAYLGPFFGADFAPPQTERRHAVELDGS